MKVVLRGPRGIFAAPNLIAGLTSLATGGALALRHPLAPHAVLGAFLVWAALAARWPRLALLVLPAALPVMNFSPWTGWQQFEEFDLLVLGAAAGRFLHCASVASATAPVPPARSSAWKVFVCASAAFAVCSVISLWRGIDAGGGWAALSFDGFQGHAGPMNAWRVFKSVALAALCWPLLRRELQRDPGPAARRLGTGMVIGLAIVTVAVVQERAAYPGLWQYSEPYRTTAFFWEMHVGGGAIDAYLAMATPFAAWALWKARTPAGWCTAALLALLAGYACLTTFARGVYFASLVSVALLGVLSAMRWFDGRLRTALLGTLAVMAALLGAELLIAFAFGWGGWTGAASVLLAFALIGCLLGKGTRPRSRKRVAWAALGLALSLEVVAVLGLGTFMRERLAAAESDAGSRIAHWRNGLALMRNPSDWLWGIGSGRLPSEYAANTLGEEFPGAVQFVPDASGVPVRGAVELSGAVAAVGHKTSAEIRGLLWLTQRIDLRGGRGHQAEFDVRALAASDVTVRVCEMHLLYFRECQRASAKVDADPSRWQRLSLRLQGRTLSIGDWAAPRRAVFSIAVSNRGGRSEFDNLRLLSPAGEDLLVNGELTSGMAHWLPVAQRFFVPWHIDNLYLEILIERGVPALASFLVAMGVALWGVLRWPGGGSALSASLAGLLTGALCIGLVSSFIDVPRIAFLLLFIAIFSVELTQSQWWRGRVLEKRLVGTGGSAHV
ncbi:MAG: hypothetical protein H7337_10845 [Rhizobacter sp.]|nr:hypothetical protein [Rhizobacter sp.]